MYQIIINNIYILCFNPLPSNCYTSTNVTYYFYTPSFKRTEMLCHEKHHKCIPSETTSLKSIILIQKPSMYGQPCSLFATFIS